MCWRYPKRLVVSFEFHTLAGLGLALGARTLSMTSLMLTFLVQSVRAGYLTSQALGHCVPFQGVALISSSRFRNQ